MIKLFIPYDEERVAEVLGERNGLRPGILSVEGIDKSKIEEFYQSAMQHLESINEMLNWIELQLFVIKEENYARDKEEWHIILVDMMAFFEDHFGTIQEVEKI